MMAKWSHLFPSRTQKLSISAPMIVGFLPRESRSLPDSLSINFVLNNLCASVAQLVRAHDC